MNVGQRMLVFFNVFLFVAMSISDGVGEALIACAIVTILFVGVTWAFLGTPRPLWTGEEPHEV